MYICLRSLSGSPTRYFSVRREVVPVQVPASSRSSHHVILVDRSGSMYADMAAMLETICKALAIQEYQNADQLVTLISYASNRDFIVHFSRISTQQVCDVRTGRLEEIRQIRSGGLTSLSGAVDAISSVVRSDEPTFVTIHSDGYVNDVSPERETRAVFASLGCLKNSAPNLVVNTIAWSDRSDFKFLLEIASRMGGRCIVARRSSDVYDLLRSTQESLSKVASPIRIPIGESALILAVDLSSSRVFSSESDLTISGASKEVVCYRLESLDGEKFVDMRAIDQPSASELEVLYLLALTSLQQGKIARAKSALLSTRDVLIQEHWRALSRQQIEAFYDELQKIYWSSAASGSWAIRPKTRSASIEFRGPDLLAFFDALSRHKRDVSIALPFEGYRPRSVKDIPGTRLEDGTIEPPPVDFKFSPTPWSRPHGIQMSEKSATMNMRFSWPGSLHLTGAPPSPLVSLDPTSDDGRIDSIAGVSLRDLSAYRQFTLVADGQPFVNKLSIQLHSKAVIRALAKLGVPSIPEWADAPMIVNIPLCDFPVVDLHSPISFDGALAADVRQLLIGKMMVSFLRASFKGKSARFSDTQVEALASCCVTPALNVSIPSTVPYRDRKAALESGQIDVEYGTSIEVGLDCLLPSQAPSANEFFARHFSCSAAEPKLHLAYDSGVRVDPKALSSRSKPNPSDSLFLPFFSELFSSRRTSLWPLFQAIGVERSLFDEFCSFVPTVSVENPSFDQDRRVEVFSDVLHSFESSISSLVSNRLRPLVFWVGSTGSLPEGVDSPPLSADQARQAFPSLKVGKALEEATFYALPNGLVMVVSLVARDYSIDSSRGDAR